jgi:uncharacterized membrane protein YbhN (UPF0104 family)
VATCATVIAVVLLVRGLRGEQVGPALRTTAGAVLRDPLLVPALGAYAVAFALRAAAWRRVLPGLGAGQSWAALHVSLLGNHVLPLRLGEPLRVASVLRRTALPPGPVVASAVSLRAADLLSVMLLAAVGAPAVLLAGAQGRAVLVAGVVAVLLAVAAAGVAATVRLRRAGSAVRVPGPLPLAATLAAWLLESAVVAAVADAAGWSLSPGGAVAVTAVTIAAQALALTPGGFGTYEAAATAALVSLGVPPGPAFAVALTTHAVKTAYAVVVGAVALVVPAPALWGRLRLPRTLPPRPEAWPVAAGAPVVAMVPVHDEAATIAEVVHRLPRSVSGPLGDHPVLALVVDDGSGDGSGDIAAAAGATLVRQPRNLGLGAAVRRGLGAASQLQPAAVVYLDADLEYDPAELELLAGPVLRGEADYVVGSRFAGRIDRMLAHRRFGNQVLTVWVRWMTRRRDLTDGQSGYRAFSRRAAAQAEVVHDYNYAQVLTLDLLGKGFRYAEVPITYAFRSSGTSFVRLGTYLRKVLPAVHRELNPPGSSAPPQPVVNAG